MAPEILSQTQWVGCFTLLQYNGIVKQESLKITIFATFFHEKKTLSSQPTKTQELMTYGSAQFKPLKRINLLWEIAMLTPSTFTFVS
jgi:hypothetical protein